MIHSTRFFVLSLFGLLGACSSADVDSSLDAGADDYELDDAADVPELVTRCAGPQ